MKLLNNVFLKALAALYLFFGPVASTKAQTHLPDQPGYYRMKLGDADVIALSDGTINLNMKQLLHETKPGEMQQLLHQQSLDTIVETSITAYLVKLGDQLILVDAGAGSFLGPTVGKLKQNLVAAGFQPSDITAILLTHLHGDHVGGLINGDQRVFPNATLYINKAEADFWLTPANKAQANKRAQPFFDPAQMAIKPYKEAGKVKTFEPGTSLFAGFTALSSPGHTPGHITYLLESKGQRIIFLGDLIHNGAVQLSDPAVTVEFDVDLSAAAAQRRKTFDDAIKQGYWIAAPHLSFPGIGHLTADGKHYQWLPIEYKTIF